MKARTFNSHEKISDMEEIQKDIFNLASYNINVGYNEIPSHA